MADMWKFSSHFSPCQALMLLLTCTSEDEAYLQSRYTHHIRSYVVLESHRRLTSGAGGQAWASSCVKKTPQQDVRLASPGSCPLSRSLQACERLRSSVTTTTNMGYSRYAAILAHSANKWDMRRRYSGMRLFCFFCFAGERMSVFHNQPPPCTGSSDWLLLHLPSNLQPVSQAFSSSPLTLQRFSN